MLESSSLKALWAGLKSPSTYFLLQIEAGSFFLRQMFELTPAQNALALIGTG
jgi:hypothetical protein